MKYLSVVAGMMLACSALTSAQVHWPANSPCTCLRIGPQIGTTILSLWNQTETFSPAVPGSPLRAFEGTRDAPLFPGSLYAGIDLSVRAGATTRVNIDLGYSYERFTFDDNTADVDVITAGASTSTLGQVQQTDAFGRVGYVEIGLSLEKEFGNGFFGYLGLAVRTRATDLVLSWQEEVVNPANSTFVGSVSNTRSQELILENVERARYGPQAGAGYRMEVGSGVYLSGQLGINYWFPRVAGDEVVKDNSRALNGGASDARLTKRDLQNLLSLRVGCSFDL